MKFAKGEGLRDMEAAVGGLVIKRHKNFYKDEDDDMHPLGTGLNGPENTQSYAKGTEKDIAKRQGDSKSKTAIKPRK